MVYVLIGSEVIIIRSFIEYTIILSILLFSRLINDVLYILEVNSLRYQRGNIMPLY